VKLLQKDKFLIVVFTI